MTSIKLLKISEETMEEKRSDSERRTFTYSAYIPERRSGKDRRDNSRYGYIRFKRVA